MTGSPFRLSDPLGGFVAHDPETGTTTQGEDIANAFANLRESVALFLEEFPTPPDRTLGPSAH